MPPAPARAAGAAFAALALSLAATAVASGVSAGSAASADGAAPPPGPEASTPHVRARLLVEGDTLVPGARARALLVLDIQPGWHTYWSNPGDSGAPTTLEWRLPPGVVAGPIRWPVPERIPLPPLANYGYKDRALHLVELEVPADFAPGAPAVLAARARWLVCSDVCIPEERELALRVPTRVGDAPVPPALRTDSRVPAAEAAALFAQARAALPRAAPAPARIRAVGEGLELELAPGWHEALAGTGEPLFLPHADGVTEPAAAQRLERDGDLGRLAMPAGWRVANEGLAATVDAASGAVTGVLTALRDGVRVGWSVVATPVLPPTPTPTPTPGGSP